MIGIHDLGGHHFGAIDVDDPKLFHADWEALTFGLLFVSAIQGTWGLDEFRHVIERMPPAHYLTSPYYVHWLEAIEELCVRDGFFTRDDLAKRQKAVEDGRLPPTSDAEPDAAVVAKLSEAARNIAFVGLGARRPDKQQSFKVGDRIRARIRAVPGHTRLPRFVWGKPGVILSYSGTYPYADSAAHRLGENPEPSYSVRFEGVDLWGPEAEPNTSVTMDMFESYMELEPVSAAAA